MKFDWSSGAAIVGALALGAIGSIGLHLTGTSQVLFIALMGLVGLAVAALIAWFVARKEAQQSGSSSGAPAMAEGDTELDVLVREANHRLAQAAQGAGIANLPVVFVIGDRSTAKTSSILNSGLEPELLAGHVYQDNQVAPTRSANIFYARGTTFVEAGGAVLGDPGNWLRLVRRLQPGRLKSIGKGQQAPRAVLLCFSLEAFNQPGAADAIASASRYLQARLGDISQALGISFPVYILFTKADRLPFFTDYVRTLSNDEATQVAGATVPIRTGPQTGVYAEEETRRLTEAFNKLFYSLADKRTIFLPRENDAEKLPGAYEFPREFRKVRAALVQFMVDVCRPSQLRSSPFLRGFYFSGVRPVVMSDVAQAPMLQQSQAQAADAMSGATGMFRVGKQAEARAQAAMAQQAPGARKVPQWLFLGHLFNDVILRDGAAMAASVSSVKVSAARRALLIATGAVCLLIATFFTVSFIRNQSLEDEAITAAKNIPPGTLTTGAVAELDSLQRLDALRRTLAKLTRYEDEGAPFTLRWGLYQGSNMYPEVRQTYYNKFRALLFGQTQGSLLSFLQRTPANPGPADDYGYAYNTLKGYLLTTAEWKRASDKSLQSYLGDLLLTRWSAGREQQIGKDRVDLAKLQVDFYAHDLVNGNPYSANGDSAAIDHTRLYLSRFSGLERVYQFLLAEAAKHGPAVTFNQKFPGTAEILLSPHPVAYAYTKEGSDFLKSEIRKANFGGEQWVLGNYQSQAVDKDAMMNGILALYAKDYINQWRAVLKTSRLVPYRDLKDASAKLSQLTGSSAPILALFWWTAQNTAIDLPGVAAAFRAVHQVEPPSPVQQYVVAANQPYNNGLLKLQQTIDQAANMPNGPDPAAEKATRDDAQNARQSTKQMSATFPVDPEGHVEAVVEDLMLKPITYAEGLAKGMGAGDLNAKGAGFCQGFGPMTRKFPFNPSAQDEVTLDELGGVFRPKEGKLWVFYEGGLKTAIQCNAGECTAAPNSPVQVNPAFVRFFNQAMKFSRALYGDAGTEPNFKYSLRPAKSDQVELFDIAVNGETASLAGGAQKSYVWPGGANRNFRLNLKLAGGTALGVQSREGLWSVFRFFADADRTTPSASGYEFFWNFRQGQGGSAPIVNGRPLAYEFTLDTGGAPAVFSKEFLAGLRCVGTVGH